MSNLVRWNPFENALSLRDAMNRLFETSYIGGPMGEFGDGGAGMALDIYETKDDVVVKATLPGVKPEDVDISVVGDVLTIKAEMKAEEDIEEESYIRHERRYGRVQRAIRLPSLVQADKAEAEFENGVLKLKVPKAEEVKPKTIQIKAK
ncbi:MAG: Hsp20/alpha crystallin family protein [Anaerolineae bacterium]